MLVYSCLLVINITPLREWEWPKILWCEVVNHRLCQPILYTTSFGLWAEQRTAPPLVFFNHCRKSHVLPLTPFPSFKTNFPQNSNYCFSYSLFCHLKWHLGFFYSVTGILVRYWGQIMRFNTLPGRIISKPLQNNRNDRISSLTALHWLKSTDVKALMS